ncbi:MAG: hypothetical protein ACXWQO_16585 [Bdellovibrionota bacterium]
MTKIFCIFFLSVLQPSAFASQAGCEQKFNEDTNQLARAYMKENKLIRKGDERLIAEASVKTRWELMKVVPAENGCLAAMAVCKVDVNEGKSCYGTSYEVLGITPDDKIVPFEQLVNVPRKIIAKIGSNTGGLSEEPGYYYVALRGKDAIDAVKSLAADFPYPGFSGIALRGKKASFDPTHDRKWQITEARYRLRRGDSGDALDIQSFQLDGWETVGADVYWDNCVQPENEYGKCNVAPRTQGFIREIRSATQ